MQKSSLFPPRAVTLSSVNIACQPTDNALLGEMLGILLVSKANSEWIPARHSVRKRRLSWKRFAEMMESKGRKAQIKKKSRVEAVR